jgi:hypothetical protein
VVKARIARTATEGVRILWEEGFFRGWQKISSVDVELAKRDNHFAPALLDMSLKRADFLTRRGKRHSYEYIQKYPYAREDDTSALKKGDKK